MKKVSKILLSVLFCITAVFAVSACGKAKIVSATVKAHTLATTVVRGDEDFTTANTVVVLVYDNKDTKEIPATELKFSEIDITTVGNKTLTITYEEEDYSFDVTIKVVASEADVNSIEQLESVLLNEYNSKRNATDEQISFKDKNEPLYVGDDNRFHFRIVASGVDGAGNQVELTEDSKVRTNIKVERIDEEGSNVTYTLLEGTALTDMVALDTENTTLDFTEAAIGKNFRVTVSAVNSDPIYEEFTTFTAENIEVVDGYNVYEEYELSLFDNYAGDDAERPDWTTFKATHNLTGINVNGLILQRDMTLKAEHVAPNSLWSTSSPNYSAVRSKVPSEINFIGTPIDYANTGLFNRVVPNGEQFNFIGNYFQLNLSQFPKMVVEYDDAGHDGVGKGYVSAIENQESYMTAHLSVFRTESADPENTAVITAPTAINYKNFNFYGNGALNSKPENSGAIILMKSKEINCNAYNTIMNNFYIGYFFDYGNDIKTIGTPNHNSNIGQYVVDSCKGYGSYQCLFYFYGAEHVIIRDSEFKTAGGPAIIADHVLGNSTNPHETGHTTTIDVINSHIESKVNSQSPWFSNYGMSPYVAQMEDIEGVFNGTNGLPATGKSIIPEYTKDDHGNDIALLDMVALFKADGISLDKRIQGYIRFFETEEDYEKHYGLNGKTQENMTYGLDMYDSTNHWYGQNMAALCLSNSAHFMQSSGSGHFVNSNLGTDEGNNQISNAVGAEYKCVKLYEAIVATVTGLEQGGNAKPGTAAMFEVPNYDALSLADKKVAVKAKVELVASFNEGVYLNELYTQGKALGLFQEISGSTTAEILVGVCAQIDAWVEAPAWTGEYCNTYTAMGMGLVFRTYPAVAQN